MVFSFGVKIDPANLRKISLCRRITGMNPKASFGNNFRSKLRGIIPSASRDCSTYQFRYAALSELEFQQ